MMTSLTKEERDYLARYASYELARRSYASYFKLVGSTYNPPARMFRHTKYVCEFLQKIIDGERKFYIVEMPPQTGKSMTITQTFPSYFLTKNPDKHVMVAAYSDSLAKHFGASNLAKFYEYAGHLEGLQVSDHKHTANEWEIAGHQGGMFATTVQGQATGKPADLLIVDDPFSGMVMADSPTMRDKVWDAFVSNFFTRRSANMSIVVIMTRWNIDDLSGRLLHQNAVPWEEIRLPAIAEDDDPIGRAPGEPILPELGKDKAFFKEALEVSGQRVFNAVYQQRPTIEGGNVFKREWIKYYVPSREKMVELGLTEKQVSILPKHLEQQVQSWDATFKSKENDDYVAGQVWARRGANFYLLYRRHARMTFTQTLKAIQEMTARYPHTVQKFIEDKANGSAIIDTLKSTIPGITPVEPQGGKEVRASAVSPLWEAGNVYLPHPLWKPEIGEMIEEMINFPTAPHDDEVDSMTQALSHIGKNKSFFERFQY